MRIPTPALTGIPFCEKYPPDREQGGYFTCLDSSANIYDINKLHQEAIPAMLKGMPLQGMEKAGAGLKDSMMIHGIILPIWNLTSGLVI